MQLGIELITDCSISFDPSSCFASCIRINDKTVEGSSGRDNFRGHGLIVAGKRIAATGRQAVYNVKQFGLDLEALEVSPAVITKITNPNGEFSYYLKNNVVLDPGFLTHNFHLRIFKDDGSSFIKISLARTDISIRWPGRGEFVISLAKSLL